MKRLYLEHPEVFQGENKLHKEEYFEGWYFKHTLHDFGISFIPGIHVTKNKKAAFIQVITNQTSYYIEYSFSSFHYTQNPFSIQIGNSFFSDHFIYVDMQVEQENFSLSGRLFYGSLSPIKKNKFSPTIMGPFAYLPFMECNHGILSMKHSVTGTLTMNDICYTFDEGIGYIEKDWGSSFPCSYLWLQGNQFTNSSASFFLSIATIPMPSFSFRGFICNLQLGDKEYRFATYNNSHIKSYLTQKEPLEISIQKGPYLLTVTCKSSPSNGMRLVAPIKGNMNKPILESICAHMEVTLQKRGFILFHDTSLNCGFEKVDS